VTIVERAAREPYPYGMPNLLLWNTGPPEHRFRDITRALGADEMLAIESSRGAAFGDIDNDGDIDILMTSGNGPARLFRNDVGSRPSWLGVRLVSGARGGDALGATAELTRRDGRRLIRRVSTDGSYLSASDPRIVFGLGDDSGPQTITVRWPRGGIERFHGLAPRRYHTLREGEGEAVR
jgi:hypothetical protein